MLFHIIRLNEISLSRVHGQKEKKERRKKNFVFILEHIKWILITFQTEEQKKNPFEV